MRCIVCNSPVSPNFDLAVCGSACEAIVEAGPDMDEIDEERYLEEKAEQDAEWEDDTTWQDGARNADHAEAFLSQYDDDPSPYEGNYSEE